MDMFDYSKAVADMWSLGGKAFLSAQEAGTRALAAAGKFPDFAALPDLTADMAEFERANQSLIDLWSSATTLSQTLVQKLAKPAGDDPTVQATLQKMCDPRSWLNVTGEVDAVLNRMADGPRFSDLWNVERKYARVFAASLSLRQRSVDHNAIVLAAWQRAAAEFSEELSKAGDTVPDPDAALRRWLETANKILLETQRSAPFLESQAGMVRASTELRVAQHDLVEYYGEQFGFPTRRELDDVHKTVTELKRELRALKRSLRAVPATPQS